MKYCHERPSYLTVVPYCIEHVYNDGPNADDYLRWKVRS